MSHPRILFLASLLAACGAASAQGTVVSGTTQLQIVGTPFSTGSGNANLWFGGTFNNSDMLNMVNWSYAQGVGTSVRPFSSLGAPTATYVGDTATFTWLNAGAGAAGVARFDAVLTMKLTELAPGGANNPGSAIVTSTMSFKSNASNAGNVAFSLFHHVNLDIFGTNVNGAPDDVYTVLDASAVRIRASDGTSATHSGEVQAAGAAFYEFNNGSVLRSKLGITSGTAALANLPVAAGVSATPFAGTDGAVAFQWNRTLAPGEVYEITTAFTVNAAVPEPGTWGLMALGLAAVGAVARRRSRR